MLGDEFGFAAGEVSSGAKDQRVTSWLSEAQQSLFENRNEKAEPLDPRAKEGKHISNFKK